QTHSLAVLAARGELIDSAQFPTTPAGMARAIAWAARRTGADMAALWVIEGAASYGATLAGVVQDAGYQVVEAARMNPRGNRGVGKSDALDAYRIAAAVLPLQVSRLRHLRAASGVRAALRVLLTAREQMNSERTAATNALTALLRVSDLGIDARRAPGKKVIAMISRWRERDEDIATATARSEAVRLAAQILALDVELATNKKRITVLVKSSLAAPLLEMHGVGPITAAVSLTVFSHPGRLRSEAAFAALAGVSPIPASSGNTVRHRLNRGGDRQLNRVLHTAVVTRMSHDPETRAYVERRAGEHRTKAEIRRCLKRYLARRIYRTLNSTPEPTMAA
ncbi:IS110 family transposase, partial [Georgenia sp. Z1344]